MKNALLWPICDGRDIALDGVTLGIVLLREEFFSLVAAATEGAGGRRRGGGAVASKIAQWSSMSSGRFLGRCMPELERRSH